MNVPFSNLNEIIHPNAESIPEYIHHFASAMFVNESFWNNQTSITDELEREGNLDDHIDSYLSHTYMLKKTHDLVTKGKLFIISYSDFTKLFHPSDGYMQ